MMWKKLQILFIIILSVDLKEGSMVINEVLEEQKLEKVKSMEGTAEFVINNMDKSVDPCDNFYQFACGGFIKNSVVSNSESEISVFTELNKKIKQQLRKSIENSLSGTERIWRRKLKSFYESCMNATSEVSTKGLKKILEKLGGWPVLLGNSWNETNSLTWEKLFYKIRSLGFSISAFVDMDLNFSTISNQITQVTLLQPHFGLGREYLIKERNDAIVSDYLDYMVKTAVALGANSTVAKRELEETLNFEIELAKASLPEMYEESMSFSETKISNMPNEIYGGLYTFIVENIVPKNVGNDTIVQAQFNYVTALSETIKKTSKRTVVNYVIWRLIDTISDKLRGPVRVVREEFYSSFGKESTEREQWMDCVDDARKYMSRATNALYVQEYSDYETVAKVKEMANKILKNFKVMLKNMRTWLSQKPHDKVSQKLQMEQLIAYTKEFSDDRKLNDYYKNFNVISDDYLQTILQANLFERSSQFQQLNKPGNLCTSKKCDATSVNAFFHHDFNTFYISQGYLNDPFFNKEYPQYLNYGRLGFVIGHEIAHSFDADNLFEEDKTPEKPADYFINKIVKDIIVTKRIQCFVNKYDESAENLEFNVNHYSLIFENLADNIGLRQSYLTYIQNYVDEPPLPGLQNYTSRQMFWISYAQRNCAKFNPRFIKHMNIEHEPEIIRVNVPCSNLPEFSKDFECSPRTIMNSNNRCTFW